MQHTLNKAAKVGFVRAFTTFLIVKELEESHSRDISQNLETPKPEGHIARLTSAR